MRQIYEYHPVIGFRFIPGLKARIPHEGGGYLVRANATGFRYDHEFESAKPADMRRWTGVGVDTYRPLIPSTEFVKMTG